MTVETEQDIEGLKYIGRIVGLTLKKMQNAACPGITTQELDDIGRAFLEEHGARSGRRGIHLLTRPRRPLAGRIRTLPAFADVSGRSGKPPRYFPTPASRIRRGHR